MYLVVQGGYSDSANSAEIWQFGVRLALVFGTIDPTGTLPNDWDVLPATNSATTGNWDNTSTWIAEQSPSNDFDPMDYLTDQVEPSLEAFLSSGAFSSHSIVQQVKLSPIDHLGHVIGGRTAIGAANTSLPGNASGNQLPLEVALAVSTQTQVIGRRGRGRFYLPAHSVSQVSTDGRVSSTLASALLPAAVDFIEGLTFSSVGPLGPHVHAIVTGSPWTSYGTVTSLRLGDIWDAQRRRRRQLDETYTSASVSA
jgi:predicted nucleic acid-binding Zn ribbon protein